MLIQHLLLLKALHLEPRFVSLIIDARKYQDVQDQQAAADRDCHTQSRRIRRVAINKEDFSIDISLYHEAKFPTSFSQECKIEVQLNLNFKVTLHLFCQSDVCNKSFQKCYRDVCNFYEISPIETLTASSLVPISQE